MHKAIIKEVKELSDEEVAYKVRCCEDPTTDSWFTASVLADHLDTFAAHCKKVEALHERKVQWREAHK